MGKRVMIVDDDVSNVDYLSTVLKKNGYEPLSARDGVEGFDKIKATKPDLLVLDVMMPRKTGFVLFKQLKKEDELKDIPVIMLTAVAGVVAEDREKSSDWTIGEIKDAFHDKMDAMIEQFRSEGVVRPDIFLDKPIKPEAFVAAVQKLIG